MPSDTLIQRRSKAIINLCLLTTPRIETIRLAQIQDIQYKKQYDWYCFVQKIGTKNGKLIKGYFIGDLLEIVFIVIDWKEELEKFGFNEKDPLFPDFRTSFNENSKQIVEITKNHMKQQQTIRNIFKNTFIANNLPYYNPHNFRHTMTRFIMDLKDMPALVALDENVGHELNIGVLLASYGRGTESENVNALKNLKFE